MLLDDNRQSKTDSHATLPKSKRDAEAIATSLQLETTQNPVMARPPSKPKSTWLGLGQVWGNFSFRIKLLLLLLGSAAIPVIAVTQGLTTLSQNRELQDLKASLEKDGRSFTQEYVEWTQVESQAQAENLAKLLQATEVNLSNPSNISNRRALLQNFVTIQNGPEPESNKSFQVFTDAQGKTVIQDIQILAQDLSANPALPNKDAPLAEPKYQSVSLPTGINLGDIPIVQNSLQTGRPLSGIELLRGDILRRLGLEKQVLIGVKPQPVQGLAEPKRPFPEGTYDIDSGKAGLVSIAVYPVKLNNRLVGTVIVGAVLNRNYGLVDKFSQNYKVPVATVFAQDWRVTTNVPYTDEKTRAIGTRVSREVAEDVLNQGKTFVGQTNIVGRTYLTFYAPLYDHQKELNPTQAKPVGISFVGASLASLENNLREGQIIAYGIGGGILLLAGLVTIPLAATFSRPLRRLSNFAQEVGEGKQGMRLQMVERRDEIGILSQELNQMAANIETNLEEIRYQEELRRQEQEENARKEAENAEQQRLAKEQIQKRALELLIEVDPVSKGDLTIRAKVTPDEVGTIADSYNAIIRSLRQIVEQVQAASQAVSETAEHSEVSVKKVAMESLQQAQAIGNALNQIETMVRSIEGVALRAKQAEQQMQHATEVVQSGDEAMNRTVVGISTIRTTVSETGKKVKRLGEASQKISKVVKLISKFAAQTNLLALNASVEAARAGEEGRGFAVVAEEVRALAQQSAAATGDIRQLVEEIQTQTNEVVAAMEVGTEQVEEGTHLVEETRQKLTEIATVSLQVNRLVQEIAQAAAAQTTTSAEVSQTIQRVAAIASDTSQQSENVATSFSQLLEVAKELQVSVAKFKIN